MKQYNPEKKWCRKKPIEYQEIGHCALKVVRGHPGRTARKLTYDRLGPGWSRPVTCSSVPADDGETGAVHVQWAKDVLLHEIKIAVGCALP